MVEEKLDRMETMLADLVRMIGNVNHEQKLLRKDMNEMKEDMDSMKEDMDSIKDDMNSMKENMGSMSQDIDSLKQDMDNVKLDLKNLNQKVDLHHKENLKNFRELRMHQDLIGIKV